MCQSFRWAQCGSAAGHIESNRPGPSAAHLACRMMSIIHRRRQEQQEESLGRRTPDVSPSRDPNGKRCRQPEHRHAQRDQREDCPRLGQCLQQRPATDGHDQQAQGAGQHQATDLALAQRREIQARAQPEQAVDRPSATVASAVASIATLLGSAKRSRAGRIGAVSSDGAGAWRGNGGAGVPWSSFAVRLCPCQCLQVWQPAVAHHFSFHGRSTTSKAQVDRCWRCSCR